MSDYLSDYNDQCLLIANRIRSIQFSSITVSFVHIRTYHKSRSREHWDSLISLIKRLSWLWTYMVCQCAWRKVQLLDEKERESRHLCTCLVHVIAEILTVTRLPVLISFFLSLATAMCLLTQQTRLGTFRRARIFKRLFSVECGATTTQWECVFALWTILFFSVSFFFALCVKTTIHLALESFSLI